MRKHQFFLHVIALLALTAGGARSQTSDHSLAGRVGFVPEVGLSIPTASFASTSTQPTNTGRLSSGFAKPGYTLGGMVEYFVTDQFAIGGSFYYNRFGFDTDKLQEAAPDTTWKGSWKINQVGLQGKYLANPDGATKFFARAGFVWGSPRVKLDGKPSGPTSLIEIDFDNAFGFDAGIGVLHISSEHIGLSADLGYTILLTDDLDTRVRILADEGTVKSAFNTSWLTLKVRVAILSSD